MAILIEFQRKKYWLIGSLEEDAALAPIDQCDKEGNPLHPLGEYSFAHYFAGEGIMRYKQKIGEREDMRILLER
jgi:hypothetical protein